MTGFNLRSIRDALSAEVEIKDETGAPTGVFFELAGPTHPKRKAALFEASRRSIARFQEAGRVDMPDPAEAEQTNRDNLAALTLGWRNYVDETGQSVPYSPQAAASLYAQEDMQWLVDQLQGALAERKRFLKRLPSA